MSALTSEKLASLFKALPDQKVVLTAFIPIGAVIQLRADARWFPRKAKRRIKRLRSK